MKKIAQTLVFLIAAASTQAASVSIIPAPSRNVVNSLNQPLAVGSYAVIGYFIGFNDSSAQRLQLAEPDKELITNFISSNFVPVGAPTSPLWGGRTADGDYGNQGTVAVASTGSPAYVTVTGSVNNAALLFSAEPANSFGGAGVPRGTRMFLLVYDTPNPANATELGIYSATTWLIPTTTSTTASMPLASVDQLAGTNPAYEVYRGTISSLGTAPLVVIPEPAAGMLGLLAGLGLIARRRR